jgi:TatD DNase family protein
MFIDSHCHLDRMDLTPYGGNLAAAIAAARDCGVSEMLCVGIDMANAQRVIEIAKNHDGVCASIGIHPMDIGKGEYDIEALALLANEPEVVAIGETGLDYFYSKDSADLQQQSFIDHLILAKKLAKPVIVHTRDAREDTLRLIKSHGDTRQAGVLHCFTESWEMADAAIALGYYISFSGIITFKNAASLREVVAKVPLERILIETDTPYLAPVPYRGKSNEPRYVGEVAKCIANIKNIELQEVAEVTSSNFKKLFK